MNKKLISIVIPVLLGVSSATYGACDQIERVFQQDTGRYDILPSFGDSSERMFETNTTLHVPVGWSEPVTAKKVYRCEISLGSQWRDMASCLYERLIGENTGSYAFWEYSPNRGLNFIGGFSSTRTVSYTPRTRGAFDIGLVATDKHTRDYNGFYYPFCETTRVYAQTIPKLTIVNSLLPHGSVISAQVGIEYDSQYSAYGVAGRAPTVIWTIQNVMNPNESYEVRTPHGILNFSPPFNGSFDVTATLYDGKYESTVGLGNIVYGGGSGGGGGIIQP
ncbi:hypothetical protein B0I24_101256 [Aliidiomarina maris]|nr:hypothetical protein B0I24_101256 [Aliidiomarina maris]